MDKEEGIRNLIYTYYLESLELANFVADESQQLYNVLVEGDKSINFKEGNRRNSNKLEDLLECFQRSSQALTRFLSSVDITTFN